MNVTLLEILRCPFCGGRLHLGQDGALEVQGGEVATGVLSCWCCAYPVVAGIPYLCDDDRARKALHWLGAGKQRQALFTLLGLERSRQKPFERLLAEGPALTFRKALELLSPDAEKTYFLYRFSDPTFLCSQAVLRAVGQDRRCFTRRTLDLCGGLGHLTRSLCRLVGEAGDGQVVLANLAFWELWLARHFLAPTAQTVGCDANKPLPFARDSFSLVFCGDAFHYIWSKRLLADEMLRLAGDAGLVLLAHLHNALGANHSPGMPLPPNQYLDLFAAWDARLFRESAVLDGLLARRPVDLSVRETDAALGEEPALILLATRLPGFFRAYDRPGPDEPARPLTVNPLYQVKRSRKAACLKLRFPSPAYEEEFADCKRYLPERVEVEEHLLREAPAGPLTLPSPPAAGGEGRVRGRRARYKELVERRVLLDLPENYL